MPNFNLLPGILISLISLCLFLLILLASLYNDQLPSKKSTSIVFGYLIILSFKARNYIRLIVYVICLILALILIIKSPAYEKNFIGIVKLFGLFSVILLYITLTPGLIKVYFPRFAFNDILTLSRRAWGRSAFIFALIHASTASIFYYSLSFTKVLNLSLNFKIAVLLGAISLLVLLTLAITSFDKVLAKLTFRKWKKIHRLIYLAVILTILHAYLRGSDFMTSTAPIPFIVYIVSITFLLLETGATFLEYTKSNKNSLWQKTAFFLLLFSLTIGGLVFTIFFSNHHY